MTFDERNIIVFQATPFCFGPASIALAIARQIRRQEVEGLKLVALGESTSYELFASCELFDAVHLFKLDDLKDEQHSVWPLLRSAAAVVSIVDFDFVEAVQGKGLQLVFVDPLYWMWEKDPIRIDACNQYYALGFPGVEERVRHHAQIAPDDKSPIVVEAVRDNAAMEDFLSIPQEDTLVLNFGGMQSPLGYNLDLALAMARCIVDVALEAGLHEKIYVCGGGDPIREIAQALAPLDIRVDVCSLPQQEFFRRIAACRDLISVPGLSIVFEAMYYAKKTLFTLPLNYSQHQQPKAYQRTLENFRLIRWEDVGPYETLPEGLPEHEGVRLSFDLGKQFSQDREAQEAFKTLVAAFLHTDQGARLHDEDRNAVWKFDGARQVARGILTDYVAAGQPSHP